MQQDYSACLINTITLHIRITTNYKHHANICREIEWRAAVNPSEVNVRITVGIKDCGFTLRQNWSITTSMGDYPDKYKISSDLIPLDTWSFALAYDE